MRAVVVPATPLLLPSYASRVDPIAELRAAVHAAARFLDDASVLTVPDSTSSSPAVGGLAPWGLRVGRELLGAASRQEVVLPGDPLPGDVLLLADGSARRQEEGGPGTFDPRAAAFDALVADALTVGDTAALAGLDEPLGAELLAAGVAGFRWLGSLPRPISATLHYADAPYGVGWFVATWTW